MKDDSQMSIFDKPEIAEEPEQTQEEPKKKRAASKPKPKAKTKQEEKQEEIVENPIEEEEEENWITAPDGTKYTESEWTNPVVPGGPTRQEVEEWKDKHGGIYFTPFEGDVYVWRTLTRPEYREVIRDQELNMLDREEIIVDKCVLFPRNFTVKKFEKGNAGVPSLLSEMIMDKSGFVAQSAPIKL